ncbi:MAG: SpoIID/LytB domain-containing protein [Thermostichus sp. DG02_5_bins_236]
MGRRQFGVAVLGSLWIASGRSVRAQPSLGWLPVELFSRLGDPLTHLEVTGPFHLERQPFPSGTWRIHGRHQQLFLTGPGQPRRYQGSLWLEGGELRSPAGEPRRYRGWIQIRPQGSERLQLINWVQLEDYLLALVPGEMPADWPAAALQAQAILARTLAVPYLQPSLRTELTGGSRAAHTLRDSTADQFYGGLTYETATTTAAVRETHGQILTYGSEPIAALFHSTCGGHTSANQDIFAPPAHPYLQGVACEGCRESPFYGPHTVQVSATDLKQALGSSDLQVLQSDPWGRPLRIQVGSRLLTGQDVWLHLGQTLGWGILPSNRFQLEGSATSAAYRFTYRGAGHGVGLCQWGSRGLAQQGFNTRQILYHYFPGTQVMEVDPNL